MQGVKDSRPRLRLDETRHYWLGQNTDFTVLVPVEDMTEAVKVQAHASMKHGHIAFIDAYVSAIKSTRLVSYWLDTKYAEPRLTYERQYVHIDDISGNLRQPCAIGENGTYYYVLSVTPEYMIVRQVGRDEHLAVFNASFSNTRLNAIRGYLLNLPISVNLRISYKLDYNTLFNWFNERYIIVE